MPMNAEDLQRLIEDGIPDSVVIIEDLRGDGDHYSAHITSPAFEGKTRIQQHQMVYAALKGKMGTELHALAIQTSIPQSKE